MGLPAPCMSLASVAGRETTTTDIQHAPYLNCSVKAISFQSTHLVANCRVHDPRHSTRLFRSSLTAAPGCRDRRLQPWTHSTPSLILIDRTQQRRLRLLKVLGLSGSHVELPFSRTAVAGIDHNTTPTLSMCKPSTRRENASTHVMSTLKVRTPAAFPGPRYFYMPCQKAVG